MVEILVNKASFSKGMIGKVIDTEKDIYTGNLQYTIEFFKGKKSIGIAYFTKNEIKEIH